MAILVSPLTGTFKSIKKQFNVKEKIIKSSLIFQKKSSDNRRKHAEKEKSINYENTLEKTLNFLGKPIKSVGRKLGFLDSLKQYITRILLGFIGIRMLKYLPQLMSVFTTILKIGNFILNMSGNLLNIMVTFIDKGYRAADHARKLVKSIGGERAIQSLDDMSNQSNSLLNSIIIAGMLFSDFGGVGGTGSVAKKAIDASTDIIKDTLTREATNKTVQQVAKQGVRAAIGPLGAAGIVLGAGLLSSAVGEGAFKIKKFGKQLQNWTGGKLAESSQDKNPITRFLKKGFFNWLSATLGPVIWLLNGTGVMFDIVGAPFRYGVELIRAAVMKLNDNRKGLEEQNKNLGKFDARVRDGIREHYSILSPLFRFVGMKGVSQRLQTPGSFGSVYGEQAAKDMGYYHGGLVIKKFAGGGYTRSVGDEDKKVEIPRTFNQQLSSINPGSAVGGTKMITKIFPNTDEPGVMNQYNYLISSYNSFSGSGDLGSLSTLVVKSLLGDKVTSQDYDVASSSLSSFLLKAASSENPQSYNQIFSILGVDKFESIVKGEITKTLSDTLGQIQSQLRMQLGLRSLEPESGPSPTSEDCACPESDQQFIATGNQYEKALLETISQVEGTSGPDGYRTMFGGGKFNTPPWRHPDTVVRSGKYASAAAGKYQFMPGTWDECVKALGLTDFSPANQDKAALWLAKKRGVNPSSQLSIDDFQKLGKEWAGLTPHYGQTSRTASQSYNIYLEKLKNGGGTISTAKISPSSAAANISDCICDPEIPEGDPGDVQAAGATAGGMISGYPVTSLYGMRKHPIYGGMKMHGGIDVSGMRSGAPYALNVPAVAGPAPQYESGYGNFIDIQVPSLGNLYFRFAHMSKPPNYKPGQQIPAGKIFGYAGTTGASTGVHLHFEVNKALSGYGGDRDPMPYGKYISIGREYGGPTLTGGIRLLHKGEYVIDKDSVDLFGGNFFFNMINQVENKTHRREKSYQLIKHLSKYTGRKIDQRPEVIAEDSEDFVAVSPPIILSKPSSAFGGGESPNWEQDILGMRG